MFMITLITLLLKTFFRGLTAREIYVMHRTLIVTYYLPHASILM